MRDSLARRGASTRTLLIGLLLGAAAAFPSGADAQTRPPACAAAGFHQFDFWLGSWDVLNARGAADGTADISLAPNGCGFVEQRRFASGDLGVAFNLYDARRGTWTQLWSAPGSVVRLEGRWQDGTLAMEGVIAAAQAAERPFRVVWTPQPDGSVRQDFFVRDGDQPWHAWFTSTYRRRPA